MTQHPQAHSTTQDSALVTMNCIYSEYVWQEMRENALPFIGPGALPRSYGCLHMQMDSAMVFFECHDVPVQTGHPNSKGAFLRLSLVQKANFAHLSRLFTIHATLIRRQFGIYLRKSRDSNILLCSNCRYWLLSKVVHDCIKRCYWAVLRCSDSPSKK